jgi:ankyrin repeat protein
MFGHSNLINVLFEYCVVDQNKLCDKSGFALLHYACFFGHFECIETLCELGELNTFLIEPIFHTSDVVFNRFSPLHCVCYNGHSSALTYLLEKYSDLDDFCIDLEDAYGNRPLHICALRNEYECASHLIEHNCNINAMNKKAQTAFMLAAANNSFNMLELLIADMSSSNTSLPTKNESISNLKGVDLMCVDNEGNNALHLSLIQKHENCALFILDHIDSNSYLINLKNKQGKTALHLAASNGFQTSVEILLSKGADLFVKDNKLRTPITSCAKNEQVADCLELLLKRLMFMLSTPAAKSILIQHGGINNIQLSCKKNATINICKNGNQNDLLNDSTYNLTSGVILNDVNMNTISNRDGDTTSTLKLNDCIRIQNEITNLNSTLNNEVEFLEPVPSEQQNIYKLVESTNCNRNLFISSFLDIIENQNGSGTGSKLNASEFLSSNIRSSSTSSFDSEFY